MGSRIRSGLILSVFALFLATRVEAKVEKPLTIKTTDQKAHISWTSEYGTDDDIWTVFCERFGKQLKSKPGPGFLSSFSCGKEKTDAAWQIELTEKRNAFIIKVTHKREGTPEDVRSWTYPTEASVEVGLESPFLPVVLARMLVETLPTGWVYRHNKKSIFLKSDDQILTLPQELYVYTLGYNKSTGTWQPTINARLVKIPERDQTPESGNYAVQHAPKPLKLRRAYWMRPPDSEERIKKYETIIIDALKGKEDHALAKDKKKKNFLEELLLGSFRSNYAGFRYGRSILADESIASQIYMISIIAEIGGGPLAGLRWYYDIFPEVKRGGGESEEYFSLKRALLGYAFSFNMPSYLSWLVTKIDLQPKIGLLDLKTRSNVTVEEETYSLDFDAKNTYDLALEVGAERNVMFLRTRIWGAVSTANFGVSNKADVTVNSLRAGVDLYYDIYRAGSWAVNLLGFMSLEHLELSKEPASLDPDNPQVSELSTDLFFAGGGFTISW